MDTKYKIIIVVFILIALLYAGHFIIDYMNSNKKKEAFTLFDDDVEHYEEPKTPPKSKVSEKNNAHTTSEESKYDLRVLILDDIESLEIADKDQKGKIMEVMFNEDTLKKVATLSDRQRLKFIQDKYNSLGTTTFSETTSETSNETKANKSVFSDSANRLISRFKGVESDDTSNENSDVKITSTTKSSSNSALSQELVHRTADAMTKLQTVQNNLQTVQKSLTDMQKYVANIDPSSKIDLNSKSGFSMPEIPQIPKMDSSNIIEGFENVRGFAPAF